MNRVHPGWLKPLASQDKGDPPSLTREQPEAQESNVLRRKWTSYHFPFSSYVGSFISLCLQAGTSTPATHLPIHPLAHLALHLAVCPSIHSSTCSPIRLSIYHLLTCPSFPVPSHPYTHPSLSPPPSHPSVRPLTHLPGCHPSSPRPLRPPSHASVHPLAVLCPALGGGLKRMSQGRSLSEPTARSERRYGHR